MLIRGVGLFGRTLLEMAKRLGRIVWATEIPAGLKRFVAICL